MTIEFENYGRFYLILLCGDHHNIIYDEQPYSFRECARFIDYKMGQDSNVVGGVICNFDTGEVASVINKDND